MSAFDIITATVSACAVSITLVLLTGAILGGNLKEKIYRFFFIMLVFNLAGSFCEVVLPFMFGTPGKTMTFLIRLVDFIDYACGSGLYISFTLYLYELLSSKGEISKKPFIAMACIYTLNIPLLAVAQFNQMFARLDEYNNYHVQDIIWVTIIFPVISISIMLTETLRHIKPLGLKKKEWISLLLYAAIPLLSYVVELAFSGIWLAYFGSTIALLLIYVNIQVDLMNLLSKKEAELTQSRVAIMLTQIQPHFIHNSLLAIQDLCGHDGKEAETAVREFSKYLRGNLSSLTNNNTIYFEKELEHLRLYLSLEQRRFEERLQVEFDLQAVDFLLPALTLQPIVENAVLHGVTMRVEGGKVTVRTREDSTHWRIIVEDTGVGFDPTHPKADERSHIGIENVRYRLESMCGGALEIQSTPDVGTTAVISIPKEGNHI